MYRTQKNIASLQLDFVEQLLVQIRDDDDLKSQIEARVKLYREELSNNSVYSGNIIDLENKIRHLIKNIIIYLSGMKVDVLEEPQSLPRLKPIITEELTPEAQITLKQLSGLFETAMSKVDSVSDLRQRHAALLSFEQLYMENPELNVQEIEQKIAQNHIFGLKTRSIITFSD